MSEGLGFSAGLGRCRRGSAAPAGLRGSSARGRRLGPPTPSGSRAGPAPAAEILLPGRPPGLSLPPETHSSAPRQPRPKEGEAAGRREVGLGADKGARPPGPLCRGHGDAAAKAPAARREGPAEAGVPSPGTPGLTCPWAEGRGGWSGSVLQAAALEPPGHPAGAASLPLHPCSATLPAWELLVHLYEKGKMFVFTDSFSLLWGKKKVELRRSRPVSESKREA